MCVVVCSYFRSVVHRLKVCSRYLHIGLDIFMHVLYLKFLCTTATVATAAATTTATGINRTTPRLYRMTWNYFLGFNLSSPKVSVYPSMTLWLCMAIASSIRCSLRCAVVVRRGISGCVCIAAVVVTSSRCVCSSSTNCTIFVCRWFQSSVLPSV